MRHHALVSACFCVLISAIILSGSRILVSAQNGNTVFGVVYGLDRRPLSDIYVELLDDLYRTVGQTRTDGLGSYTFSGVGTGNITIRVRPFLTAYQEQEVSIEIRNAFTLSGTGGYSTYQQDVYLRLRKGADPAAAAVFLQDVPKDAEALYEKAVDELKHKNTKAALEHLRAAISLFPKYFSALELLAGEYVQMGRPETFRAAEILFKVAVEVNPRSFRSWYGLAYSLYSMERYPEALAAAKQASDANALFFDAALLYAVLLRHAKRFEEAERRLVKAKDLFGSTPRVHWELALLYGNDMSRFADAARELKLFLKAQPDARDATKIRQLIVTFEERSKAKK
ncbi:MAG: tetratricopeptide repeat protein [Chloracidobacterium sp.]|nr:tetratricopeptide repeat protein [Chloracidobacterium sp.]